MENLSNLTLWGQLCVPRRKKCFSKKPTQQKRSFRFLFQLVAGFMPRSRAGPLVQIGRVSIATLTCKLTLLHNHLTSKDWLPHWNTPYIPARFVMSCLYSESVQFAMADRPSWVFSCQHWATYTSYIIHNAILYRVFNVRDPNPYQSQVAGCLGDPLESTGRVEVMYVLRCRSLFCCQRYKAQVWQRRPYRWRQKYTDHQKNHYTK